MTHLKKDLKGVLILSASEIKLGDIVFNANDFGVYIVANISSTPSQMIDDILEKPCFSFTLVSSVKGKVYIVPESFISIIGMKKMKMFDETVKKSKFETPYDKLPKNR